MSPPGFKRSGTVAFLSAITVQELETVGLQLERKDLAQGAIMRGGLDEQVLPTFADRLLPVDTAVVRRSARPQGPEPQPERDGLIAATALVHGMTIVTRNVADFHATGAPILNPWDAPH
jgi:hypothetical protein